MTLYQQLRSFQAGLGQPMPQMRTQLFDRRWDWSISQPDLKVTFWFWWYVDNFDEGAEREQLDMFEFLAIALVMGFHKPLPYLRIYFLTLITTKHTTGQNWKLFRLITTQLNPNPLLLLFVLLRFFFLKQPICWFKQINLVHIW